MIKDTEAKNFVRLVLLVMLNPTTMKAPEEIVKSHASRIMKQFDMDNFKRDFPTLWKTIEESLKAMQSDHEKESAKHHDLLTEILEYMEAREDADIEGRNKEMRFAMGLREMLKIV